MRTRFFATALFAAAVVPACSLAADAADADADADADPDADPAKLYQDAARLVLANADKGVMCPNASTLAFDGVPPYSAEWYRYEDADFPANAAARELAHRARSLGHPHWPDLDEKEPNLRYLNRARWVANELADAALYQHLKGDDAAAVETVRDELHLADLLEGNGDKEHLVMLRVAAGIHAQATDRLMLAATDLHVSDDPADKTAVPTATVKELVKQLCDRPDAAAAVRASLKVNITLASTEVKPTPHTPAEIETSRVDATRTVEQADAESGMAALSLACHLYKADHGTWPTSPADLPPYCPAVPVDPFGGGKRTLGYALIPHGLPDGRDRPLVYARETADGTLAYRDAQPAYGYYILPPVNGRRNHGQFRDVVLWRAAPDAKPTTVPFAEP